MAVTMYGIMMFFAEYPKAVRRGEIAVNSKHVLEVNYDPTIGRIIGKVQSSQRAEKYKVEAYVNEDGTVNGSSCGCARRMHLCHHVAALLLASLQHISKTDKPCTWNVPAKPKNDALPCSHYYPTPKFRALNRTPDEADKKFFYERLQRAGITCGYLWLLAPEPPVPEMPAVTLDELLSHPDFVRSDNQLAYFLDKVALTQEKISRIERDTRGQRENMLWSMYRKCRLTASNFGKVIKYANSKKSEPSKSLLKCIMGKNNLTGVKAVQWGIHHESTAIAAYEKNYGVSVQQAGLFLHPNGLLGASPDGLVGDDTVLEMKCPWSIREATFEEAIGDKNFFLKPSSNGLDFHGPQGHAYWHQIQGQMALTGRSMCHFFVWTPRFNLKLDVEADPAWMVNIEVLTDFYKRKYFSYLVNETNPKDTDD